MAAKFIQVNGVKYRRADALDINLLLDAWHASKEYTDFLPEIAAQYAGDPEGLGEKLRDKFSMWVSENLLATVEDSIDWLGEAHQLARRDR